MYTKTYKGRFRVLNPAKYKGDITSVIYRSLWELRFMKWCDLNENILEGHKKCSNCNKTYDRDIKSAGCIYLKALQ